MPKFQTAEAYRAAARSPAPLFAMVFGLVAGIAFTGYVLKPAAPAVAAVPAVVAIDYDKITAAVKAGMPAAPAVVAKPAAVAPAPKPAAVKRKPAARPAAPAVVYYVPAPRCGCGV